MCRLTLYKGRSLLIGDLIVWPDNSLLCQSRDAHYHPGIVDDHKNRRNQIVNGDGFGVCWYNNLRPERGSCCFKFVTPAWSDINLRNIGAHVESSLIMAHIRAAAHDPLDETVVSMENCHPFKHRQYTFMHNGAISNFKLLKLALLNLLTYDVFRGITGSTDSEHIFALFLNHLPCTERAISVEEFITAVEKTMSDVLQLCASHGIVEPCSLNFVISDGITVIATRFRSGKEAPPSMYYNYGSEFVCDDGHFLGKNVDKPRDIVISSAPLSRESIDGENEDSVEGSIGQWILIPRDHMLVVVGDPTGKDISIVSDCFLRPLEIEGYSFQTQTVQLLRPMCDDSEIDTPSRRQPTSLRHLRNYSARTFARESQTVAAAIGANLKCNRIRTLRSRDNTPRPSITEQDVPPFKTVYSRAVGLGTPLLFFVLGMIKRANQI